MKHVLIIPFSVFFLGSIAAAQLSVVISQPKIVGQKAVVPLMLTNNLAENVESARAICFLLNDHGELIGQSAKWVIGGTKNRSALKPRSGTTFSFVITSQQPFTSTNLTAKVSFSRVILAGGQLADPTKDVIVEQTKKN